MLTSHLQKRFISNALQDVPLEHPILVWHRIWMGPERPQPEPTCVGHASCCVLILRKQHAIDAHGILGWHSCAYNVCKRCRIAVVCTEDASACYVSPGLDYMLQALVAYPLLRVTLLHWKQCMRMREGTQYIGPNVGQDREPCRCH